MDDMLGGNRQAAKQAKGSKGMSNASMKALISADASIDQVKIQGAAKGQAEGKAGVFKAEIKLDSGRGGDTKKKEEELAKTEEKVNEITQSQMNALSDINKKVDEAAKADREAEKVEEKLSVCYCTVCIRCCSVFLLLYTKRQQKDMDKPDSDHFRMGNS